MTLCRLDLSRFDALSPQDAVSLVDSASVYPCRPSRIDFAAANESYFAAYMANIAADVSSAGSELSQAKRDEVFRDGAWPDVAAAMSELAATLGPVAAIWQ